MFIISLFSRREGSSLLENNAGNLRVSAQIRRKMVQASLLEHFSAHWGYVSGLPPPPEHLMGVLGKIFLGASTSAYVAIFKNKRNGHDPNPANTNIFTTKPRNNSK